MRTVKSEIYPVFSKRRRGLGCWREGSPLGAMLCVDSTQAVFVFIWKPCVCNSFLWNEAAEAHPPAGELGAHMVGQASDTFGSYFFVSMVSGLGEGLSILMKEFLHPGK